MGLGQQCGPIKGCANSEGPIDVLDHSTNEVGFGGKMIIDATAKWRQEGYTRQWPKVIEMSEEVKKRIDAIWDKLNL